MKRGVTADDSLGGWNAQKCAPVSLIPSFLPFLQASQLSPFPLDSSPSSFLQLDTQQLRLSPIRHLRDYQQLEKLKKKKKVLAGRRSVEVEAQRIGVVAREYGQRQLEEGSQVGRGATGAEGVAVK